MKMLWWPPQVLALGRSNVLDGSWVSVALRNVSRWVGERFWSKITAQMRRENRMGGKGKEDGGPPEYIICDCMRCAVYSFATQNEPKEDNDWRLGPLLQGVDRDSNPKEAETRSETGRRHVWRDCPKKWFEFPFQQKKESIIPVGDKMESSLSVTFNKLLLLRSTTRPDSHQQLNL